MIDPGNNPETIRRFELFIEKLTEKELSLLNKMVIHRFKLIGKAQALLAISRLKIGDKVWWDGKDGIIRRGIIIRLNHKTASVKIGEEGYWQVSPQFLNKED